MQYLCCKIPRTKIDNKKDTYFCIALTNIYEYFGSQVSKLICTSFGLGEIASLSDIFMYCDDGQTALGVLCFDDTFNGSYC